MYNSLRAARLIGLNATGVLRQLGVMTLAAAAASLLLLPLPALPQQTPAQAAPAVPGPGDRGAAIEQAISAQDWNRALSLIDAALQASAADAWLWSLRGDVLDRLGRTEEAVIAYERGVTLAPQGGSTWNNLCWARIQLGQWRQARAACVRAVELRKTMASTINLGHTYLLDGDSELAYRWYRESVALISSETELHTGPLADFELFAQRGWQIDASTKARRWIQQAYVSLLEANALNDQIVQEYQAARYAELLLPAQRALVLREQTLGVEHPLVSTSLNNLALQYQDMGRYEQALPLIQRALSISEKAEGPEHPNTGTSLNNLALVYQAMGRYEQALPLFQRALAISEKAEGPEHPSTGTRLNNLA